mgnify:CR=1 FL=1
MDKNDLIVLYSTDETYARHAATSIYTLLENNKSFEKIKIYIISNNLSSETKKKFLRIIEEFERELKFIDLKELLVDFEKNNDYPISSYARLLIENIILEDKILYIDCDTIVVNSLKDIWKIDLQENLIAGVQDALPSYLLSAINIEKNSQYINAGVLLINLKKWRDEKFKNQVYNFLKIKKGNVVHHDQGIINHICNGKIKILEPKYNVMPEIIMYNEKQIKKLYQLQNYYNDEELKDAKENPVIIHFISKFYNRPWNKKCTHPYKDNYLEALSKTGFSTKLENKDLSKKVKLRKFIYKMFPFEIYCTLEHLLNKRREKIVSKI